MVAHRRAGKTVACICELVHRALYSKKKRPRYAYIAPQLKQGKKIAWEYLKEYTEGLQAKKPSETELTVILRNNGAEITIYGADNPDSFRGQYFDGVILDEYGDMHPGVWSKVLLPTLSDRSGWAVFIGTPKGKNHFYEKWNEAGAKANWFRFMLKASESGIFNEEQLAEIKAEISEDEYQQEYECSFDAAVKGTYYAALLNKYASHIRLDAEWDPAHPVYAVADLGYTDSSAYWFWQERPDGVAIIDFEEASGEHLDEYYFPMLRRKGYRYGTIWLPHDAKAKFLGSRKTTVEQFLEAELPRFNTDSSSHLIRIVPNLDLQDGIEAVRKLLPVMWFHPRCEPGLQALRAYRRNYDEEKKVYSDDPRHDWASHPADSIRYLSIVANKRIVQSETKAIVFTPPVVTLNNLFEDRESRLHLSRGRI